MILFLGVASWLSIFSLQPFNISNLNEKPDQFSTLRAYEHVKEISKKPHYIGSENHSKVRNYIIDELEELGLNVQTQKGFSLSNMSTLTIPENIIARIEGTDQTGKALLLLSHYDSAVHSSYGASDAASGVATILETLSAFKEKGKKPKNDIIILFSDAEEVGLNGAKLFAKKHPWAKDVGLVLNFESRGSGGPSNMIIETNYGNKNLINTFSKAKPEFPVASSLMYNIYKMLPNDTDSTVFREEIDVPSFFFAFIDDHYDYHTAKDIPERLDKKSLAHQGSYLDATLNYLSDANLNQLKSEKNDVYFNFPFVGIITYSYNLSPYLIALSLILLIVGLIYGFREHKISTKAILNGFLAFSSIVIVSLIIGFAGWQFIEFIYPDYQAYLQGFTPNGHYYILGFVLLAVSVYFYIYDKFFKYLQIKNALVAPIFYWLVINILLYIFLPGGAFFILPLLLSILIWFVYLHYRRFSLLLISLILLPIIFINVPYIKSFPVGLGLNSIYISCLFSILTLGLLTPIILPLRNKKSVSYITLISSIIIFLVAHFNSNFNKERPKPNSLVYYADHENEKAYWKTYDRLLDSWTKPFFDKKTKPSTRKNKQATFESKYNNQFTHSVETKYHKLSMVSVDKYYKDNVYSFEIKPHKNTHRISLFKVNNFQIDSLYINDRNFSQYIKTNQMNEINRLLTYYVVDRQPIFLKIFSNKKPVIQLNASSYTLFTEEELNVNSRPDNYIPKPFVLNDAIINKSVINFQLDKMN